MITNPLNDIIPAKYRKQVYALLALCALVFAAFQASDGDWAEFVGALFTALVSTTAASNTSTLAEDNYFDGHGIE